MRDAERILSALDRKGILEFSRADFSASLRNFRTHIAKAISLLQSAYSDEILEGEFLSLFPKWIKDRVLGIFNSAASGDFREIRAEGIDEGNPILERIGPSAIGMEAHLFSARFANDRQRGDFLRNIVLTEDQGQEFGFFLTPYHARVLLLHLLASRMTPDEQDELASELELKSNVTDFIPSRSRRFSKKFDAYIFHDGYFYGATGEWTDSILRAGVLDPRAENTSTDCSIFTQKVLEAVGYRDALAGVRMTSGAMMEGDHPSFLSSTPLCSERQLEPGDLIARNGHVYLFTGYGKNEGSGQWELRIAEATGTFSRTVRVAALPLYQDDPGECRSSLYTATPYRRFRLRAP